MRRIRQILSTAALVITPLGMMASQTIVAEAAIPHAATPSVSITAVGLGNAGLVNVTAANLVTSSGYNTVTIKVTCSGTHTNASDCYNSTTPLSYYNNGMNLSDVQSANTSWVKDGSTYSNTATQYIWSVSSDTYSIYFPGLVNGVSYSATVKLNSGSESSPSTFTVGDGAVSNVTFTTTNLSSNPSFAFSQASAASSTPRRSPRACAPRASR